MKCKATAKTTFLQKKNEFSIHSFSFDCPVSLHLAGSRDAMVNLSERSVCVLDHQTMAAPANSLAIKKKPGAVAVFALVNAPARVL